MTSKILVVDDEPDLQILIEARFRKAIKNREYEFYFARNGLEALNLLRAKDDLSIVLTDLNMPVMDGLALLKNLPDLHRPYKAIVVSAYGDMSNIRTAMNYGASDFVMKPIDFNDFELTVKKMVEEYSHQINSMARDLQLKDIQRELDVARMIQEAMVPKVFNLLPELEIAGTVSPAKEVGGDFFDIFLLDKHELGIFIADVSGKSISACLYMIVTKSLLRALAKRHLSCVETIKQLNELLCADNSSSMFVTGFYAILDTVKGTLTYCNAGHNVPYIISKDASLMLIESGNSIAMGIDDPPAIAYTQHEIPLQHEDSFLLYTDGVTEAMNPDHELFSVKRMEEILQTQPGASPEDLIETIIHSVKTFAGDAPQSDDLTLLATRFNPTLKA